MQSKATSVTEYLAELPPDRRKAISAVRGVIRKNLGKGYKEGIQYGMIGYFVPHSVFPDGYHCDPKQPLPFASIASQKNHMAIYMMCIYGNPAHEAWFRKAWSKTGKKLDMGKSCIRFKKIEDVPLEVIGEAVKRIPAQDFIDWYETATLGRRKSPKSSMKKASSAKAGTKKVPAKKATKKKAAGKKVAGKKRAAQSGAKKVSKAARASKNTGKRAK